MCFIADTPKDKEKDKEDVEYMLELNEKTITGILYEIISIGK